MLRIGFRIPETVVEADARGWSNLMIHCDGCRLSSDCSMNFIMQRTARRRLLDICQRLRCERCLRRPASIDLEAIYHFGISMPFRCKMLLWERTTPNRFAPWRR